MKLFAASTNGLIILAILLGIVLVIGIIAFVIYKMTHPKLKTDDKPNEQQIIKEEMDKILQPIEDDEINKKVNDYKQDD